MTGLRNTAAVLAAAGFALGGCAAKPVPLASADGDYRGTSTRYELPRRRDCPRPRVHVRMQVRSGQLFLPWDRQYVQATVYSNGTVTGDTPGVQASGTYDGSTIQVKITDGTCFLQVTLKREPG